MAHSCKGCTNRWTGMKMAHCPSCHETFSTPANFDRHRKNGKCVEPTSVGLEKGSRDTWRIPFELETVDRG